MPELAELTQACTRLKKIAEACICLYNREYIFGAEIETLGYGADTHGAPGLFSNGAEKQKMTKKFSKSPNYHPTLPVANTFFQTNCQIPVTENREFGAVSNSV